MSVRNVTRPGAFRPRQLAGVADRHVGLVLEVPADDARAGDARCLRVDGGDRATAEAGELLVRVGALDAEEEVDAGADGRRVVRRALAPDHAREDRVAVDAERRRALDGRRSGRERARAGRSRLTRRDAGRKRRREDERRAATCRRSHVGSRGHGRCGCRAGPRVGPERSPCLCCHPVPPPGHDAEPIHRRGLEAGERRARGELSSGHGGR